MKDFLNIDKYLDNYAKSLSLEASKNKVALKESTSVKTYSIRKHNSAKALNEGFNSYLMSLMENDNTDKAEDKIENEEELKEAKANALDISDSKSSTSKVLKDTMNDWASMTTVANIATFVQKKFDEAGLNTEGSRKIIERVRKAKSVNSAIETLTNSMMDGMGLGMKRGSGKRESYEIGSKRSRQRI